MYASYANYLRRSYLIPNQFWKENNSLNVAHVQSVVFYRPHGLISTHYCAIFILFASNIRGFRSHIKAMTLRWCELVEKKSPLWPQSVEKKFDKETEPTVVRLLWYRNHIHHEIGHCHYRHIDCASITQWRDRDIQSQSILGCCIAIQILWHHTKIHRWGTQRIASGLCNHPNDRDFSLATYTDFNFNCRWNGQMQSVA